MVVRLFQGGVKRPISWLKLNTYLKESIARVTLAGLAFGMVPADVFATSEHVPIIPTYRIESSTIHVDLGSPAVVVLNEPKPPTIQIGESHAQEAVRRERALATRGRVPARAIVSVRPEPDLATKRALVQRAATAYQVPWEILEAVWQVESGKSWDTARRSYAGAAGPAQFMPATWRRYGVDGNGDGVIDIQTADDAIYGAAHYLAANGANRGEIRRALFAYNHAGWYVDKVLRVAEELGYSG